MTTLGKKLSISPHGIVSFSQLNLDFFVGRWRNQYSHIHGYFLTSIGQWGGKYNEEQGFRFEITNYYPKFPRVFTLRVFDFTDFKQWGTHLRW